MFYTFIVTAVIAVTVTDTLTRTEKWRRFWGTKRENTYKGRLSVTVTAVTAVTGVSPMYESDETPELIGKYQPGAMIGTNERGDAVGEWHPRARLSNEEVDLMRELYEGGMGISEIARKFGVSKGTTNDIVKYHKRVSPPIGWRRVRFSAGSQRVVGGSRIATGELPTADNE